MKLKALFQRRQIWTIALYKLNTSSEIFKLDSFEPFRFFGEKALRKNAGYQATTADPFLFVHGERLYLFHEIKTDFCVGEIWAQSMDIEGVWTNHGQVLKENFHLSYPQVFLHDARIWMIPEAASSGKVWLYTAESFPSKWQKVRALINEPLLDPSIIIQPEGIFLLGTTQAYELKVYFAADLDQEFVPTGIVISNDKAIARNAGTPLKINDVLYRAAQNCRNKYGESISLSKIERLSTDGYSERMTIADLYGNKPQWMEAGYHHISSALFRGECFVAVDGISWDSYSNTLLLALIKIVRMGKKNGWSSI